MPRIIRTEQAEDDVVEIAAHIAMDNPAAADRLIDTFDQKLRLLAESPGLGPERPELLPGLRSFPVGNYLLFYRPIEDGIELLRVVHGARSLRRLFRR